MPELPEVETVRRGLVETTLDWSIAGGAVLLDRVVAHPDGAEAFLAALTDARLAAWERRGKYLLGRLARSPDGGAPEPAGWLGVHLRMTGQLLWTDPAAPLQPHARARLFLRPATGPPDALRELRFVDCRTFGRLWWVPPHCPPPAIVTGLQRLGPEPFSAEFSADYLHDRLRRSQRSIKAALLDQALVAGVGNIYADEALFLSGLRPQTPCRRLGRDRAARLREALIRVLADAIAAGGTTFSDFANLEGINGNYGGTAWVYGRAGEPCRRCQTPIARDRLAGRSTHYCPQCQR